VIYENSCKYEPRSSIKHKINVKHDKVAINLLMGSTKDNIGKYAKDKEHIL